MKISGFSIVRNAVKYQYPVIESITSVLPLCDEFVISLGNSEDSTENLIKSIKSEKIRIIHSVWDDSLQEGGHVLADETNKAFNAVANDSDWCFYIQADEVLHEKYYNTILESMNKWKDDKNVEGILFNYTHFYATYDYIANSRHWYNKEIRIIRNDKNIQSYKDAQGFRINGRKLNVKKTDAHIFHYGWVKDPATMLMKQKDFARLWHDDESIRNSYKQEDFWDFSEIDSLEKFSGTHPLSMQNRIDEMNWKIELDISKKNFNLKDKLLYLFEKITGHRLFAYKNYRII